MHRLFAEGMLEMPDVFSIRTGHHPERSEGTGLSLFPSLYVFYNTNIQVLRFAQDDNSKRFNFWKGNGFSLMNSHTFTFPSPNKSTIHCHPERSEGPGLLLFPFIHRRFQYKHPVPSLRSG
jgi:hypothetical protein